MIGFVSRLSSRLLSVTSPNAWFAKVVHPEILDADRREFFTFAHSVVTNAQRQSNRGNEMCDNEMSRDHDAPVEY